MQEKSTGLDINDILIAEYQYIAQSAFQANEDRARVSNYYFVTAAAAVAAIVGTKLDGYSTSGVYLGFSALFMVLSLIGLLTLLQLARLRSAWTDSARAMNLIKQYYIEHFKDLKIDQAFAWTINTIPKTGKKRSLSYLLALSVIIVDSVTFATSVAYLGATFGVAPINGAWLAAAAMAALLFSFIQQRLYTLWLDK